MRYLFFVPLFAFLIFAGGTVVAQDQENKEKKETEPFKRHVLSIMLAHTHIPNGFDGTTKKGALIVPSWGLNYSYRINEQWAIGWHNDMEIATYIIEYDQGKDLERERPIITSLIAAYTPKQFTTFVVGFGREFEKHENFWVFRAGVEFEFEFGNNWAMSPSFIYDLKESVYDSWTLGITIGKWF